MTALLFQIFAILAGVVEAILYARRGAESFHWNEHIVLIAQRASVLVVGGGLLLDWHVLPSIWWLAANVGALMLLFSFAHNNAYNLTRIWITWDDAGVTRSAWESLWSAYRVSFKWNYQSATSTARFEFTARQRNSQAVAGLLLLAVAAYLCTR
jgi:hypothetical protein